MSNAGDQSNFKMEVKKWLRSHGFDYKWMADQCGVSEITVRNWMSQKKIPLLKEELIKRVIAKTPASHVSNGHAITPDVEVDASLTLTVKLSPELYSKLETKAKRDHQGVGELIAKTISGLIEE